ncbi:MAG TPA: hypothetical protein VK928_01455, partial [Longimicrobiales bacterium]|nr:hypothetical protein [Longimicrobiales bacterium]
MRAERVARLLMVAALAVSSAACARMFDSYDVAPSGLVRGEEHLRSMLGAGQAAVVLDGFGTAYTAPDDDVLHALYEGVLAYYAGDYARSAAVLDAAAYAADDRVTKSISRSAMSLVSNDRVLPYEPGRTERLMLPYYAALARLRLGDYDGAAVEARRLSALLEQYRDDGAAVDPALAGALRYVAGAIFESSGNTVDADVAYRNALALDSSLVVTGAARGAGSVVVILEQGFVAHRVEQALAVMLLPEEIDAIAHGDGDEKVEAAGYVAGRIVQHASYASRDLYDRGPFHRGSLYVPAPDHTPLKRRRRVECTTVAQSAPDTAAVLQQVSNAPARTERHCEEKDDDDDGLPYLLKVAWPVYRTDSRPLDARVMAGTDTVAFFRAADVSRGVVADFESERALVL